MNSAPGCTAVYYCIYVFLLEYFNIFFQNQLYTHIRSNIYIWDCGTSGSAWLLLLVLCTRIRPSKLRGPNGVLGIEPRKIEYKASSLLSELSLRTISNF